MKRFISISVVLVSLTMVAITPAFSHEEKPAEVTATDYYVVINTTHYGNQLKDEYK